MITIGIIDDNKDQRESFKEAIKLYLKKTNNEGVEIFDSEPLSNPEDYSNWIEELEIDALIIDEKLMDTPLTETGKSCGYLGHQLIENLRGKHNNIPIHVVTSATINDDLKQRRGLYENLLSRDDFLEDRDTWVEIFIRSCQKSFEERKSLYDELSEISRLIIDGRATSDQISRLKSLQEFFQIPLYTEELINKEDLLKIFKGKLEELNNINQKAKEFINFFNNELEKN